jgi:hypothetical protein
MRMKKRREEYYSKLCSKGGKMHLRERCTGNWKKRCTFPLSYKTTNRGNFKAKSTFVDDDKAKHLEYEYSFKIAKVMKRRGERELVVVILSSSGVR